MCRPVSWPDRRYNTFPLATPRLLGPSVDQTRIRNDEIDPIERVLVGVRRFWYAADRMFVYAVASMFD